MNCTQMVPSSRLVRFPTLLICTLVLLSSIAGAVAGAANQGWSVLGFEVVIAISCLLGILIGLGRFASGVGIGIACIGGAIAVGSILGAVGVQRQLGGVSLDPFVAVRVLSAVALGAIAIVASIERRPEEWRTLLTGGLVGLPVVIACSVMVLPQGRGLMNTIAGLPGGVRFGLALVTFIVLGTLFSVSVHLVIKAFDRATGD